MKNWKKFSTVLTATSMTLGAIGAHASLISTGDSLSISGDISSQDTGSGNIGYVSYGGGSSLHCYAGAFSLSVTDNTKHTSFGITSFCTDVGVTWQKSDNYTAVTFSGQSGVNSSGNPSWSSDPQSIENAAYIYNNIYLPLYNSGNATASVDAGVQLAIWKVLYDTTSNGTIYNTSFSSGQFKAWGFSSAAMADAEDYVLDVNAAINNKTYVTYSSLWLDPSSSCPSQGLIYSPNGPSSSGSPIPEASTVFAGALLLLPLGVSAFRVLRKNRATA